jgi:hypothetical protein
MSDFDEAFEELAKSTAEDACRAEALADKVDAMKALFPYYALRKKMKPDDDPGEGTMAALAAQIQEADNAAAASPGQSGVRSRRNGGAAN